MARNPQQSPAAAEAPAARNGQPAEKSRLRQRYERDVVPTLVRDFNYQNPMQVPRLAKISVNVGVGESISNSKALDAAVRDVTTARTDQEARRLLELLGMPFQREGDAQGPAAVAPPRRRHH